MSKDIRVMPSNETSLPGVVPTHQAESAASETKWSDDNAMDGFSWAPRPKTITSSIATPTAPALPLISSPKSPRFQRGDNNTNSPQKNEAKNEKGIKRRRTSRAFASLAREQGVVDPMVCILHVNLSCKKM